MNRTFAFRIVVALFALIGAITVAACSNGPSQSPIESKDLNPNKDWLLFAESDAERYRLIQTQLRGFDQPMWEVGERYRMFHEALQNENYPLAKYHWSKIGTTIRNGVAKRPPRVNNANLFFLDSLHGEVADLLEVETSETAKEAFDLARSACVSCHHAEGVEWMNQQSLLQLKLE